MPDSEETPRATPEFYTDTLALRLSPYTVTLYFAVRRGTGEETEPEPVAVIRMSPEHAKVMAIVFKRALKELEESLRILISIPPSILEEKDISLETDW